MSRLAFLFLIFHLWFLIPTAPFVLPLTASAVVYVPAPDLFIYLLLHLTDCRHQSAPHSPKNSCIMDKLIVERQ